MRKAPAFLLMCMISLLVNAQEIPVTFRISADSISVDSVRATNLNTNQSVVLPGNETLILEQSSGINQIHNGSENVMVHPNPFNDITSLSYRQFKPGEVVIAIYNHFGQRIHQTKNYLDEGEHSFTLSMNKAGIYFITFSGNVGKSYIKAICAQPGNSTMSIAYTGISINESLKAGYKALRQPNEYRLAYSNNQVMHFTCYGGKHTTIFTDTVEASIDYDVEFVDCTDPDGRTYNVVKIGDQFWMEENLAFLPAVNPSSQGADTIKHYYVYGYEGTDPSVAKTTDNYKRYGVLYNHKAAKIACPENWHLPSYDEWMGLWMFLVDNNFAYTGSGEGIAKSMASRSDWKTSLVRGGIGNKQENNNSSGFNSFPSGMFVGDRYEMGFINEVSYFWSSTQWYPWTAHHWIMSYDFSRVISDQYKLDYGYSVRCVKDE